jgi:hypothetical protein
MSKAFDKILDECVNRINRGEGLEDCLASYPEYAEELKPLLRAMLDTRAAYAFTPSPAAKTAARQRFNAALESLERRRAERYTFFPWLLGKPKVWATVTAVLLVALIGYFGIRPMLFPTVPGPKPLPVMPIPEPSPEGNFVFLISDDVNAIGDFKTLNVTISKVGLQTEGEAGRWVEFDPEVGTVDLTRVQADKAQQIWRGDIPESKYAKVFIHVSDVSGILKETNEPTSMKLPSEKLQISKRFEVTSDSVVNFVYDVTVIQAGKSGMYILQPQVDQSGADRSFEKIE